MMPNGKLLAHDMKAGVRYKVGTSFKLNLYPSKPKQYVAKTMYILGKLMYVSEKFQAKE